MPPLRSSAPVLSLVTPLSSSVAPVLAVPIPVLSFFAPAATFVAPLFSSLIRETASATSSERCGARSASAWACFWRAARFVRIVFRSPSWSATSVSTSSATRTTSAVASLAFFRSAQAGSGSTGVSQRVRYTASSVSAAVRAPLAATGAVFTSVDRWPRTTSAESATSWAVSPMVFSLSFR